MLLQRRRGGRNYMMSAPWMVKLPVTLILALPLSSLIPSFPEIEEGGLSAQPHPLVLSI